MTGEVATEGALLKTALHQRHLEAGARMVDFGGWDMPIQYRGIRAEHLAVRSGVGVFDLSHMGPLAGADASIHDATVETAMIGFQGPESERLLQELVDVPLGSLRYYAAVSGTAAGHPALIARTGYTGEDGFELIVSAADGPPTW